MSNFVDRVRITAKAGNGGNGSVSFHREKFVINGGPDGGDGGNGGSIVFLADPNMHTLLDFRFRSKYTAENGEDGRANRCTGKNGENLTVKVPVGTVVRDEESGRILADMDEPGKEKILLRGGRGVWGNQHYATSTRQAPNFSKPGVKTEIRTLVLELKTIADVGLVGYPNVGKSSILSAVTSAKPKVGNYHFTTLTPNLGIVRRYGKDIVLADIPGLIEGASEGAGLGHSFLRHVERTRLLLHVVDSSGLEGRDPIEDIQQINRELKNYGDLGDKPQIIVCNKMDLAESREQIGRIREYGQKNGVSVFEVSAATRQGFEALFDEVEKTLETLPPPLHYTEESLPEETVTERFEVVRDGDVFEVRGPAVAEIMGSVNFEDTESLNWFHRTLKKSGIIDALREAGASEGATVRMEEMEFDFVD